MDTHVLARLNRVLADPVTGLGRNPHGQPMYKWAHTRELQFPLALPSETRSQGGIFMLGSHYQWTRQIEDDRWVLAVWDGSWSEAQWNATFRGEVPWPRQGMYYASDIMLKPGVEPNDQATNDVLGKVRAKAPMTMKDFLEHAEAKVERAKRETEQIQSDYIDDVVTAFGNIPGKRGGSVSFGGI